MISMHQTHCDFNDNLSTQSPASPTYSSSSSPSSMNSSNESEYEMVIKFYI